MESADVAVNEAVPAGALFQAGLAGGEAGIQRSWWGAIAGNAQ